MTNSRKLFFKTFRQAVLIAGIIIFPFVVQKGKLPGCSRRLEKTDQTENARPFFAFFSRPQIAVILEHTGQTASLNFYSNLDRNITIAVLPVFQEAWGTAVFFRQEGFSVLAHLPMQPAAGEKIPWNKNLVLMADDNCRLIDLKMEMYFEQLPEYIKGCSIYAGTAFLDNYQALECLAGVLKKKRMYFIGSKNTSYIPASEIMRRLKIPAAFSDIILDNNNSYEEISRRLAEAVLLAEKHGSAICTGQIGKTNTLAVLSCELKKYNNRIKILPASELCR
ncbi:MAG: hypothetical protein A2096_10750 [Spirochaetes bacterium GWF1_41_5]|nr:MAG: hypothetical protein A2096_10750 [Spirochaetes bacterium GWF1_41_5]